MNEGMKRITGRVGQVIRPEVHNDFLICPELREAAKGKLIVVVETGEKRPWFFGLLHLEKACIVLMPEDAAVKVGEQVSFDCVPAMTKPHQIEDTGREVFEVEHGE